MIQINENNGGSRCVCFLLGPRKMKRGPLEIIFYRIWNLLSILDDLGPKKSIMTIKSKEKEKIELLGKFGRRLMTFSLLVWEK